MTQAVGVASVAAHDVLLSLRSAYQLHIITEISVLQSIQAGLSHHTLVSRLATYLHLWLDTKSQAMACSSCICHYDPGIPEYAACAAMRHLPSAAAAPQDMQQRSVTPAVHAAHASQKLAQPW